MLIWDAAVDGEVLNCYREVGNTHDTVGVSNIPRVIFHFLRRGGIISCKVNRSRRYSADLPQGGLEIPCILTFQSTNAELSDKSKKLMEASMTMNIKILNKGNEKMRVKSMDPVPSSSQSIEIKTEEASSTSDDLISKQIFQVCQQLVWVSLQRLSDRDIESIIMGGELSDIYLKGFKKNNFLMESTLKAIL